MLTVVILIVAIFLTLFVLELLNETSEAFNRGYLEVASREPSSGLSAFLRLPQSLLAIVVGAAGVFSHFVHEVAHATFQFLLGLKPRIVWCRGGGYAQGTPWGIPVIGQVLRTPSLLVGNGLSPMAPLIVAGGIMLAAFWLLTPFDATEADRIIGAIASALDAPAGQALASLPAIVGGLCFEVVDFVRSAGVLRASGLALVVIFFSQSATPSSTDYIIARWSLAGFAAASVLAAGALFAMGSGGTVVLLGSGGALLVVGYVAILRSSRDWPEMLSAAGGLLFVLGLLALTPILDPPELRNYAIGLASVFAILVMVAVFYVAFVVFILAFGLLMLAPQSIWAGIKRIPEQVMSAFRPIGVCPDMKMMFQGECDYCGLSYEALAAGTDCPGVGKAQKKAAPLLKKVFGDDTAEDESAVDLLREAKAKSEASSSSSGPSMLEQARSEAEAAAHGLFEADEDSANRGESERQRAAGEAAAREAQRAQEEAQAAIEDSLRATQQSDDDAKEAARTEAMSAVPAHDEVQRAHEKAQAAIAASLSDVDQGHDGESEGRDTEAMQSVPPTDDVQRAHQQAQAAIRASLEGVHTERDDAQSSSDTAAEDDEAPLSMVERARREAEAAEREAARLLGLDEDEG